MKKLLIIMLALALIVAMSACSDAASTEETTSESADTVTETESESADTATDTAEETGETSEELTTIGWISAAWSDDYCKRMSDALVEQAADYGFKVEALNGNLDVTTYIECIDTLAEKEVEGIIIQPLFSVPDFCMQFNESDTPLVFLNIAPQLSDTSADLEYYYVGSYEYNIGAQLAVEMANGLEDGAKICMICLMYGQDNTTGRLNGFVDWMTDNRPDVEILETNYVTNNDVF